MNALVRSMMSVAFAIAVSGCAGCRHSPGFSMHDSRYFMEPPYIAQKGDEYFLRWRYGSMGFYFSPESRVRDGGLLFSLQATTSTGSRSGRVDEIKIEGESKIQALKAGGAYWREPDGRRIQLKIVRELSNKVDSPNERQRRHLKFVSQEVPLIGDLFRSTTI